MSQPRIPMVTLHTGDVVMEPVAHSTWLTLRLMFRERPMAFLELVEVARDPAHRPFGNTGEQMMGLLRDGVIHAETRKVILAAVTGDGFDMALVDPVTGVNPRA